jgi:hypothetical protein
MENKQTAVEWLEENLPSLFQDDLGHYQKLFAKAKEMEREQHGETWDAALIQVDKRGGVLIKALVDFDKYWEDKKISPPGEHCEEA